MHSIIIIFLIRAPRGMRQGRKCDSNWELLLFPVGKEDCKTFFPMSRIRPVTAMPAPQ